VDLAALRDIRLWASRVVRLDEATAALGRLVDARVVARLRRVERQGRAPELGDAVGVLLATADGQGPRALVEAEGALAAALVARVLRRPVPRLLSPSATPSPNVAGAFGAILVAAARASHAGTPLRILSAGPAGPLVRELGGSDRDYDVATYTVTVDLDAYLARLRLPRSVRAAPTDGWDRAALAALGNAELELPLVAAASTALVSEVGLLAVGDVWLPGTWLLRSSASGGLAGPLLLAPPGLEYGIVTELGDEGRVVVQGRVERLDAVPADEVDSDSSANMSQDPNATDTQNDLVDAIGEAPLVVRVEVGVARMRARDWAALAPGDVVALGRRIADPVVLRAGGTEIARGELVEIEGEVGVRIIARVAVPPLEGSDP